MLIFRNNPHENPFSEIMNNYLQRQLLIAGNINIIKKVDIQLSYSILKINFRGLNNELILFDGSFVLNPENKDDQTEFLKNYMSLLFVAQLFETFEAFLKDTLRELLLLKTKDEVILSIINKSLRKTNSDIVKLLMQFCPSLTHEMINNFFPWLSVIENIRHRIVHNNQLFDEKAIQEIDRTILNYYFDIHQTETGFRLTYPNPDSNYDLIKDMNNYSFRIFQSVSKDENYPVSLTR